jgi:hypothetical protein
MTLYYCNIEQKEASFKKTKVYFRGTQKEYPYAKF